MGRVDLLLYFSVILVLFFVIINQTDMLQNLLKLIFEEFFFCLMHKIPHFYHNGKFS